MTKFFRLPIAFLYGLAVLVQSCGCMVNAMMPKMDMAESPCHQMAMQMGDKGDNDSMPMACCIDGEKHNDSYVNPPQVEEKVVSIAVFIPHTELFEAAAITGENRPNIQPNAPPDIGIGHFQKNVQLRL